jgi:dihydrofolate reductase
MRDIVIIAAIASNGVIGNQGTIPWSLPGDMAHFKKTTQHHITVMGRRTFESLPAPLLNRINIVVTTSVTGVVRKNVRSNTVFRTYYLVPSWPAALALVASMHIPEPTPLYVIGGAQLYAAALADVTHLCLTHIDRAYEGDVYMPDLALEKWNITSVTPHRDVASDTDFTIAEYKRG